MITAQRRALVVIVFLLSTNILSVVGNVHASDSGEDENLLDLLEQLEGSEGASGGNNNDASAQQQPQEQAAATGEHDAAEDILDGLDDDNWSPSSIEEIEVDEIGATHATFIITEISYDGTPVESYRIYYANNTLATVQDYSQISDVVVGVVETEEDELEDGMVKIMLENLEPETTYYVLVAPVHPSDETVDPISMISDEVTFQTEKEAISADTKIFDNVSYTYANNNVTVTWDPSDLAKSAEVHIRHQSEGSYTKVGTPTLGAGTISFQVDKTGNYFLKLVALDDGGNPVGKEHIQTIKIDEVGEVTPEVTTPPQVGPTANAMIGLMIFAFIVYLVYRFRRIER